MDTLITNTERLIEQKLGNEFASLEQVEDTLIEMASINWEWQNDLGRVLLATNDQRQSLVDGISYKALDALHQSGSAGVNQMLNATRDSILQLRDQYIATAVIGDTRLRELSQVLLEAGRRAEYNDDNYGYQKFVLYI